jgi:predicted acyltransferase (DUF342 family)
LTHLAFFALTLGLLALPFAPALVEWRRRSDAEPLHVEHDSTVSPRHFAVRFREFVATHVQPSIDTCRTIGRSREIDLPENERCLVVHRSDALLATDELPPSRELDRVLAACGDLQLPSRFVFTREIYAPGSVYAWRDVTCRAILARQDIVMGTRATVLRWAHAGNEFRVGPGSSLYGRLTAGREIHFEGPCVFERLNAPRILLGEPDPAAAAPRALSPTTRSPMRAEDLTAPVDVDGARWLVRRDVRVPAGALVRSDVVVLGAARIGRRARIEGGIKSHGTLFLEEDVVVEGSVVSDRSVVLSKGCRVLGPILAEETIYIHPGAIAGTPDKPTTVSAWTILVALGAVCHGTMWARNEGRVVDTTEGFPA